MLKSVSGVDYRSGLFGKIFNYGDIIIYVYKASQLPYKRTFAWVLKEPLTYKKARYYNHPLGAIIWVNLS